MKQNLYNFDVSYDIQGIVSRVANDIEFFNGKSVLVTGATGFFGWWLLSVLQQLNRRPDCSIKLYAVSRNPNLFLKKHPELQDDITFLKGDLRSFSLDGILIDYCFHMATTNASETFNDEDQINKIDLLYLGTKNLMSELVKAGTKKILFTSSGVIYGALPTQEDYRESSLMAPATTEPSSALGEGKRLAEYVIAYYCKANNIHYNIARCFSFVGPHLPLDLHYAIGNFIYDALNEDSISVKGTGLDVRSYLYIADAISWLLKMMVSPAMGEIYNVGSSRSVSIKDLAVLVRDHLAPEKQVIVHNKIKTSDNFERSIYVPNTEKIVRTLSVDEWSSLDESILKTAAHAIG